MAVKDTTNSAPTVPSGGIPLYLILAGALLVRVLHLIFVAQSDIVRLPIIDAAYYHVWAGVISKGSIAGSGLFFMSPLYPYLMGLIYAIFGVEPWRMMLLQIVLSVSTVYLMYRFTASLLNRQTGLIAAAVTALYAPFIFYDATLLTASLILFLSALILNLSLSALKHEAPSALWWLGIVLALSALARPLVLLFVPLLLWAFFRAERRTFIRKGLTVCGAILLVLLPVGVRNLVVGGEFVLTASSGGMNFYVGNNPTATGLYWEAPFLTSVEPQYEHEDYRRVASEQSGRKLTTGEAGSYWRKQALSWIANNPLDYLKLLGTKIFYFWNRAEFANNVSIYAANKESPVVGWNPIAFGLVAPIGLIGLLHMLRKRGWVIARIPLLWLITYFAGGLLFFIASEYRLPAVLALIIGASYLAVEIVERFRSGDREAGAKLLVLAIILLPFVNLRVPFIARGENPRMDYFNFGNTLMKQERPAEAAIRFEKAIAIDPYFAEGLLKLAEAYYRAGDIDKAMAVGKRVGLDDPQAILRLIRGNSLTEGYALLHEGKFRAALQEFLFAGWDTTKAVAETTRVSRLMEAQQFYQQGQYNSALSIYRTIRQQDSLFDPSIEFNTGFLFYQLGYLDSAEHYTGRTLEHDSLNAPAVRLMAQIYNTTGRQDKAEMILQRLSMESEQIAALRWTREAMDSLIAERRWMDALNTFALYGDKYFPELQPEDRYRIGKIQLEIGQNLTDALRLLEEAEQSGYQSGDLYHLLGRAYRKLERVDEAVNAISKGLATDPESVPLHLEMAEIALGKNDVATASAHFKEVEHLEILDSRELNRFNELKRQLKKQ